MTKSCQHWATVYGLKGPASALRPQNVIRWVRRGWGSNETPTTTITKYNPEDLRLSNLLVAAGRSQGEAFYLQRIFTSPRCESQKTSELAIVRKLAVEDGKQALLQRQYAILCGNLSQSTSRSFPYLLQSTCICSSLTERRKSPPK